MTRKTSSYHESLLEALADPAEAAEYLNAAIEDSPESFLKALGNVAQARQMTKVAKESGIQRETLYRSFSAQGNPTFSTLSSVLRAVGITFDFMPVGNEHKISIEPSPIPTPEPLQLVEKVDHEEDGVDYALLGNSRTHDRGLASLLGGMWNTTGAFANATCSNY